MSSVHKDREIMWIIKVLFGLRLSGGSRTLHLLLILLIGNFRTMHRTRFLHNYVTLLKKRSL